MSQESFVSTLKTAPSYLKIRMFMIAGSGLVVLLASLLSITWIWKAHRGPIATEEVLEHSRKLASHETKEFEFAYEVKDMSMALLNRKGTRTAYAQFTLIFDCPDEESKHVLEMNRAKIIDGIFEVGGDFTLEEFQAPLAAKGFEKFKKNIQSRLQTQLKDQAPRLVVLKDWVMN